MIYFQDTVFTDYRFQEIRVASILVVTGDTRTSQPGLLQGTFLRVKQTV